jgi:hypothetical protein
MRRTFALLLLTACLDENSLSGSMSEVFPLGVSRVDIHKNDQGIQVTYLRNRNIYLDVVARVTVALKYRDGGTNPEDGGFYIPLVPGTRIDVAGDYELGHPVCTVVHAPGGEPVRLLPPVQRGDFYVASGGNPGEITSGDFSMVFKDQGGDIGFGRTLVGRFSAETIDAGFGPLP